jgi:hypothetical protein
MFSIAPADSRYPWLLVPVGAVVLGTFVLLPTSVRGAHASRFEVRADGLRSPGDLDGRLVLRLDLAREESLRPKRRRMGTGRPGYQTPWFTLRSGEKALRTASAGRAASWRRNRRRAGSRCGPVLLRCGRHD